MSPSLDEVLTRLGQTDPTFNQEVRNLLAPVKDRFFALPPGRDPHKPPEQPRDGLHVAPPFLKEPDLRQVAIALAELALQRGIDVNVAFGDDGSTFLHVCVLLREDAIALEGVVWLLAHGADPHRRRDDGETPLSLAVKFGRIQIEKLMRSHRSR